METAYSNLYKESLKALKVVLEARIAKVKHFKAIHLTADKLKKVVAEEEQLKVIIKFIYSTEKYIEEMEDDVRSNKKFVAISRKKIDFVFTELNYYMDYYFKRI
jgi:hypothetical protein